MDIMNPIILGESMDDKSYVLDLRVTVNDYENVYLEMQVIRHPGWDMRLLAYLCRSFDSLNRGSGYTEIQPILQAAFMDFTMFKEEPEFVSTYKMINEKTGRTYTEDYVLRTVDLQSIDLAEPEDVECGLVMWAKFFKAGTWEELKMIAKKEEVLKSAASAVYQMTEDERIRERCQMREEYWNHERVKKEMMSKLENQLKKQGDQLKKQGDQLKKQGDQLKEKDDQIKQQGDQIKQQGDQLKEKEEEILRLKQLLAEQKQNM